MPAPTILLPGPETLPAGDDEHFRSHMLSWSGAKLVRGQVKEAFETTRAQRLYISSPFGWRSDPIKGIRRRHDGVDLPGRFGTRVYATGAGVVTLARVAGGYGNLVQIDHSDGVRTRYGHLSRILVSEGMVLRPGSLIGEVGSTGRSTGPHLHYEVRVDGRPVDPLRFMGQTVPRYETTWTPDLPVTRKWAGWETIGTVASLPQARIR
ncbi:MAG: M23 family metallopeptidase [Sphingomicrobium sp.]